MIAKDQLRKVCRATLPGGTFAWILNRKRSRNDQAFGERAFIDRSKDGACEPRIDRQRSHPLAQRCQITAAINSTKFGECFKALSNQTRAGRFQERELGNLSKTQCLHLQDDIGKIGAQQFGGGEWFAR